MSLTTRARNLVGRLFGTHAARLAGNSSWMVLERVVRLFTGFVVGIFVARYFGPERYGSLQYARAMMSFAGILVPLGLHFLVVRELVRRPSQKTAILGTTFGIELIGGAVAFAGIGVAALLLSNPASEGYWVLLIVCASLLLKPFDAFDYWFESRIQSRYNSTRRSIAVIVTSLVNVPLLVLRAPLTAFAVTILAEAALSGVMIVIMYQRRERDLGRWRFSWSLAGELLGQSWLVMLSGVMTTINLKVDQLLLRWMRGEADVGVYSVAVTLSESWYFIATAIVASANPLLIRTRAEDPARYQARLQKMYDLLFCISLVVAVVVNLVAGPLVSALYGPQYAAAASILTIHVWAGLFAFSRQMLSKWLIIEGHLRWSLFSNTLGAVANILLNLLLIPRYATIGSAVATLISYGVSGYFAPALFRSTRPAFIQMSLAMLAPIRYPYQFLKSRLARHSGG
jgi:O-antigen/teichoic acid export membrane protein